MVIEITIIIKTRDDPNSHEHKTIPYTRNASTTNADGRQRHQTTYLREMMYLQHDISRNQRERVLFPNYIAVCPCRFFLRLKLLYN